MDWNEFLCAQKIKGDGFSVTLYSLFIERFSLFSYFRPRVIIEVSGSPITCMCSSGAQELYIPEDLERKEDVKGSGKGEGEKVYESQFLDLLSDLLTSLVFF